MNLLRTLKLACFCLLFFFSLHASAATTITATRVWPAPDYTRITLESNKPIRYSLLRLKDPERLVVDLDDVDLGSNLKSLSDRVLATDPYIRQIRVGNFKPGVVRMVIDLKTDIRPELAALPPAGEYQHRLVLDIYPALDPLMAMLEQRETPASNAEQVLKPDVKVLAQPETAAPLDTSKAPEINLPGKPEQTMAQPMPDTTKAPESAKAAPVLKAEPNKSREGGRVITIAIDAGHGGEDPGAKGANGSYEKNITLAIAKKLKQAVDAEPNMRGVLTRDGDYFIPLHGRVVKARKLQADLFVSIHADAALSAQAKGSSVFALSEHGATSAMARLLAQRENESDLIGGVSFDVKDPYLARTLLDLSQTATINDSLKLGKSVLDNVGKINNLHKQSVEQAGFAVLKSPDIPSILVETAFITNPEEERKLNDENHQDKLVNSILTGIKKYFASNPALAKPKMAEK